MDAMIDRPSSLVFDYRDRMRGARLRRTWAGVAIAAWTLGCSGQTSNGACGSGSPCGGSLVGTWNLTGSCIPQGSSATLLPDCPDASGVLIPETVTGQFVFNGDATYSAHLQVPGIETFSVPMSCGQGLPGPPLVCDNFSQYTMSQWQKLDASPLDVTCNYGVTTCACSAGITAGFSEQGTYATSGNSYTLTPAGSSSPTGGGDYCVQGSGLRLLHSKLLDGRVLFAEMQAQRQ
jgi:hypothetical protein